MGTGLLTSVESSATFSGKTSPLWLNANKYGVSSVRGNSGYLRVAIKKPSVADMRSDWRLGYGLDLVFAYDFTSPVVVQQLYADIDYKKVRLSVGSKERLPNLKDPELSSGSQTLGINARPVPEVRFEIPDYLPLTKAGWFAIRGHLGYGMMTDASWQKDYVGSSGKYAQNVLYHSKSGFLRIGNEHKFPLVFEGGIEMAGLFGGVAHVDGTRIDMGHSLKSFGAILVGAGHDPTDGQYPNAEGDIVGSWLFSLSYKLDDWKFRAYYDHFFEDHSAMFFEYGWNDGLLGLEVTMPRNAIADKFVYEYVTTEEQSGPIYHDGTPELPTQISARDNYYNHLIYNGWQHWGQPIGNPLFTSPLYNPDRTLRFLNNRFTAHHFGLSGTPVPALHYRVLLSFSRNLGIYDRPFEDVFHNASFLTEVSFRPNKIGRWDSRGWSLSGAFALDRGRLMGDNTGFQLTLRKQGSLNF